NAGENKIATYLIKIERMKAAEESSKNTIFRFSTFSYRDLIAKYTEMAKNAKLGASYVPIWPRFKLFAQNSNTSTVTISPMFEANCLAIFPANTAVTTRQIVENNLIPVSPR